MEREGLAEVTLRAIVLPRPEELRAGIDAKLERGGEGIGTLPATTARRTTRGPAR
jgi:hypothetical protein